MCIEEEGGARSERGWRRTAGRRSGSLDLSGIAAAGANASERVVNGLEQQAEAIVQPEVAAFQAANAAGRTGIEIRITTAIEAEAEERGKRDLKEQLVQIRRDGGLGFDGDDAIFLLEYVGRGGCGDY